MVKRCRHVGGVAERFNGDNRIILPLEAVITPTTPMISTDAGAPMPAEHRLVAHRSAKLAGAWRDANQEVGGWLLHGYHLDDALRGLFGRSLPIEELLCAPAPIGARRMSAFDLGRVKMVPQG